MAKRGYSTPVKSGIPEKWNSPRTPTFKSPSKVHPILGYITQVSFFTTTTNNGNKMFDVSVKVGEDRYQDLKVMVQTNTERDEFLSFENIPVKILTSPSDTTLFYNQGRGSAIEPIKYSLDFDDRVNVTPIDQLPTYGIVQFVQGEVMWSEEERVVKGENRVRKATLKDGSAEVLLTLWNKNIDHVAERQWYRINNVQVNMYYGMELSTTRSSIIHEIHGKESVEWSAPMSTEKVMTKSNNQLETITDGKLVGANVETELCCPWCSTTIHPAHGVKIHPCENCGKKVNTAAAAEEFSKFKCNILVVKDGEKFPLDVPRDVVSQWCPSSSGASNSELGDVLCMKTRVTVTFDKVKKIAVKIEDTEETA